VNAAENTDVLIIGSGFGGAITAYHLAAGGARVTVLERGPWLDSEEFDHDFKFGSSTTRVFDFVVGDGMSVLGGNCVGGGSVVYFATMPRAPRFVFERRGGIGRRMWPEAISRDALEPWYDRVAEALPVTPTDWSDVPYIGGVFAAACQAAGHTCNPSPSAVDAALCTNCNWMMSGCRFDAKRSLLLNYLPAALSHGAEIRPLHEVQKITRLDDGGSACTTTRSTRSTTGGTPAPARSTRRSSSSRRARPPPRSSCSAPRPNSARCRTPSAATSPATASG
jgi:choline dehydrogenase-like flavoprotein